MQAHVRLLTLAVALGASVPVYAQPQQPGESTFTITWAPASVAVPTLGTMGTLALSLLLLVVAYRVLRRQRAVVRVVGPILCSGLVLAGGAWTNNLKAGGVPPLIDSGSCSGSETYTAVFLADEPPCFINSCGQPVTVSYEFVSGTSAQGSPLTAETCTLGYFCDPDSGPPAGSAVDGGTIPSDGQAYATAYCQEIEGMRPNGGELPIENI